ncbi:MAG TPA: GNAT family N-acetyltransferase [Anaerolineae bacterium]|nr:GNAT family N-acetyltransferase [Anaerolineae bacterium]
MAAIRPAVADDYELICQLFSLLDSFHARLLPSIFQETDAHVRPYHYIADLIEQPDTVLFLAEAGDTAVGLIHVSIDEAADLPFFRSRRYAVVHNVIVREEMRGQGIGRRLMAQAHEWAVDRGATSVELSVWTANQEAMSFYEALGYSAVLVRLVRPLP